MRRKATNEDNTGPPPAAITVMRLYVSGHSPNSVQAVANLAAICKEYLAERFTLEIVDVLKDPLRALADGIIVTPSLTKVSPSPVARIVGNLRQKSDVLLALGIKA
jgi:circadian clock protein KaiB